MSKLLILIFYWSMLINHGNAVYIYGLVLHNPIPDDLGIKSSSNHHDPSENFNKYQNNNNPDDNENNKKNFLATGIDSLNEQIRCKQDSDCIDDDQSPENLMYCDQHYGFCDYFRGIGELCRHDSQCDGNLICMFGRCRKPSEPGTRGSRCTGPDQCQTGLCCARQHSERICKPKLKFGQQCFVPLGGLDYSLNELCPCDQGLECRGATITTTKRKRNSKSTMRCTKATTNTEQAKSTDKSTRR